MFDILSPPELVMFDILSPPELVMVVVSGCLITAALQMVGWFLSK